MDFVPGTSWCLLGSPTLHSKISVSFGNWVTTIDKNKNIKDVGIADQQKA